LIPDSTKYNLDYRPASYWTTPGDGAGEGRSVRRRPFIDLGREFLPHKQPNEVEIALISLASVTGDVVAITARRRGRHTVYNIVDEYAAQFLFEPKQSQQPLSMGELIALIDGATGHLEGDREGLTSAFRNYNLDACAAERLVDFVTVTSNFYPELRAYYAEEAVEWLARVQAK
jgi:hypothetical protein